MKKFLMVFVIIAFGAILAGNAMAMTISGVDFRDGSWSLPNDTTSSKTVGNVTVTASATTSPTGYLSQDTNDGFGVLGGENDEIDYYNNRKETLRVDIAGGMYLRGVWLTDIFLSKASDNSPSEDYNSSTPTGEPGRVVLNDGAYFDFVGNQSNTGSGGLNGELFVDFKGCFLVNKLVFSVLPDSAGSYAGIEYSVAGLESCVVPEPATMLLLGFGLAGLAGVRRRMQS